MNLTVVQTILYVWGVALIVGMAAWDIHMYWCPAITLMEYFSGRQLHRVPGGLVVGTVLMLTYARWLFSTDLPYG